MAKLSPNARQSLLILAVSLAGGFVLFKLASVWGGFGYAFAIGIPLAVGTVCGSIPRSREIAGSLIVIALIAGIIVSVLWSNIAGLLCALIFLLLSALPFVAGLAIGGLMKARLERRGQNSVHVLAVLALPLLPLYYEGRLEPPRAIETVTTSRILELSADEAWRSLVFYEQVALEPPALARIGLPTPLRVEGAADQVGAITRCVYENGYLEKRISVLDPARELAFEVIEQHNIEDRSIDLIDGSFTLAPVGPGRTRLTLSTRYRSLLQARIFWRPFEHSLTRALHQHVLDGIEHAGATGRAGIAVQAP